jgi:hypothetical protein
MKIQALILANKSRSTALGAIVAALIAITISPCFADNSSYDGYELNESAYQTPPALAPTTAGLLAPGSFVGQTGYGYDSVSGSTSGYPGLPPTCLAPVDINVVSY